MAHLQAFDLSDVMVHIVTRVCVSRTSSSNCVWHVTSLTAFCLISNHFWDNLSTTKHLLPGRCRENLRQGQKQNSVIWNISFLWRSIFSMQNVAVNYIATGNTPMFPFKQVVDTTEVGDDTPRKWRHSMLLKGGCAWLATMVRDVGEYNSS